MKEKEIKKGKVEPAIPVAASVKYTAPEHSVKTKLKVDNEIYNPNSISKNVLEVKACMPADHNGIKRMTIGHRMTSSIDCGCSIEMPPGFRAVVSVSNNWASKGLCSPKNQIIKNDRVKFLVSNIGKEIIVINDGDVIGEMWIEHELNFEFN